MRGLIHILTMLAFAVHAVVGCCLHHHHESQSAISHGHQNSKSLTCQHRCKHQGEAHAPGDHQDDESNDEIPCDESPCAFQAEPLIRVTEMLISSHGDPFGLASTATSSEAHRSTKVFVEPHSSSCLRADAQSLRASLQIWIV